MKEVGKEIGKVIRATQYHAKRYNISNIICGTGSKLQTGHWLVTEVKFVTNQTSYITGPTEERKCDKRVN